jgi:hypothetical protein
VGKEGMAAEEERVAKIADKVTIEIGLKAIR